MSQFLIGSDGGQYELGTVEKSDDGGNQQRFPEFENAFQANEPEVENLTRPRVNLDALVLHVRQLLYPLLHYHGLRRVRIQDTVDLVGFELRRIPTLLLEEVCVD